MWMHDAEQTRYPKRVVRGPSWKPEWQQAPGETGAGTAGGGGDVLPLPTTVPSSGVAPIADGAAAPTRRRPYRVRLHFARPARRG